VNNSRNLLRINVGFLINQPVGTSRDIEINHQKLSLPPDLEMTDFSGKVHIGRAQQGILVQGSFEAVVNAECVRCLALFEQPLQTSFTELYAFTRQKASEMELVLSEDGNIDLAPMVREYLSMEIPISPLCREDCRGLCPVCGEDLNLNECEHQQKALINTDRA